MRCVVFLVVALAFLNCALTEARQQQRRKFDSRLDASLEIRSHAQLISRINHEAEKMRAEQARLGVQGYFCKTIWKTDARDFTWATTFVNSKYGEWIPTSHSTISVFLQGEASAQAFVGISAGIGIGMDFAVNLAASPKTVSGQVTLFACIGADLSIGYVGAGASVGGGLLVGFGAFKDSVLASNVEIDFDVEALVGGGVGILIAIDEKVLTLEAFRTAWTSAKTTAIGAAANNAGFIQKTWDYFKRIALTGLGSIQAVVKGIHIHVGVGVGATASVALTVDLSDLVNGIKAAWERVWSSRVGTWVKNTKAWANLKKTLNKLGDTKFGNKFRAATDSAAHFIRRSVDDVNTFFDYTDVAEDQVDKT